MPWSSSRASSRAVSRARALPHHVELHACRLCCLRIAPLTGRCPLWRHVLPVGTIAQINFGSLLAWSPSTAVSAWCVRFGCCFVLVCQFPERVPSARAPGEFLENRPWHEWILRKRSFHASERGPGITILVI